MEPKTKAIAPNIALVKWARWCSDNGFEYQYCRGIVKPDVEPDKILLSCIFSYNSRLYEKTIDHYIKLIPDAKMLCGGVFTSINPKWFNKNKWSGKVKIHKGLHHKIENLIPKYDVNIKSEGKLPYSRDKIVLYASRGCENKCAFCAVPKLEGKLQSSKSIMPILEQGLKELPEAKSIVLYDNIFSQHRFFKKIVNELSSFGMPCDIHGLHVDNFTREKAKLLSKLQWQGQGDNGTSYIRFSFDKMKYAENIRKA
ncbi:MAG: hypothetical protein K8R74_06520, partial [Bacteroidales bacterium]|nr:hypothetical protein [Bacteroidales bacterium]